MVDILLVPGEQLLGQHVARLLQGVDEPLGVGVLARQGNVLLLKECMVVEAEATVQRSSY